MQDMGKRAAVFANADIDAAKAVLEKVQAQKQALQLKPPPTTPAKHTKAAPGTPSDLPKKQPPTPGTSQTTKSILGLEC